MELRSRRRYWDQVAGEKKFHHPLRLDWLDSHLAGRDILDCGCGYGRLLAELSGCGYRSTVGTDFAEGMLKRCQILHADLGLRLVQTDGKTLPFRDDSFDAVLLFTLLTCMPMENEQRSLFAEIQRILRPRGLVYISDLLLNTDPRNANRYEEFAEQYGIYGVFRLPEGVVVRHHSEEWIKSLTEAFDRLEYRVFTVTTMNSNTSAAFQYLGRLRAHDGA
jgi:ubiquinone/menaquinone biosynthesis C-methylase UbiE